jgi:hypothetical protein
MTWSRFDIFVAVLGVALVVPVGFMAYQVGYELGRPKPPMVINIYPQIVMPPGTVITIPPAPSHPAAP